MNRQTTADAGNGLGDFQTPETLAHEIISFLSARGVLPNAVIEPSCGLGSLLLAAMDGFPSIKRGIGLDISGQYLSRLRTTMEAKGFAQRVQLIEASFFEFDWTDLLPTLPDPLLVIGNPPWVTNSYLSSIGSQNVPSKTNLHGLSGIEAITGKSNFDISEWMLMRIMTWLEGRQATLAMLCKTVVARKLLRFAWNKDAPISSAAIYGINASKHFGASVDACLLVIEFQQGGTARDAEIYNNLAEKLPAQVIGYRGGELIARMEFFHKWKHLLAADGNSVSWRSGVKHDCAKIMEFSRDETGLYNGMGEAVCIEDAYLFPMLKSSDVARDGAPNRSRWMLVTQRAPNDNTRNIEREAPKTWRYLMSHSLLLDNRGSSIYRKRPRFSVFGIGDYTFAPWKVAISGFYKQIHFRAVGPHSDRPTVFDDTCYFLPCQSQREAETVAFLLNSDPAREFYEAFTFWDSKRPITADLLKRIDFYALAHELRVDQGALPIHLKALDTLSGQLTLF